MRPLPQPVYPTQLCGPSVSDEPSRTVYAGERGCESTKCTADAVFYGLGDSCGGRIGIGLLISIGADATFSSGSMNRLTTSVGQTSTHSPSRSQSLR